MIALRRLSTQHLLAPAFREPADEVRWLVAVQSQDYLAARWSLGQRLKDATAETIDRAFDEGAILRTHLLRPTWHFVAPQDIRWLLELTGPRIAAANASVARKYGVDERTYAKSRKAIARALRDRHALTRQEVKAALQHARIPVRSGQELAYLVMDAERVGLVCSGPRRGREFTYMLLEERVAPARPLDRDQALAELASRYFAGHGPATARDLAKWSWLTLSDARRAIEAAAPALAREDIDGDVYFGARCASTKAHERKPRVHLLSIYDEYLVGYTTLDSVCRREWRRRLVGMGNALNYVIAIDGQIAGTWRRTIARDWVTIEATPFKPFTPTEKKALTHAAERFARFHGIADVMINYQITQSPNYPMD